jgi:hypothetical protein
MKKKPPKKAAKKTPTSTPVAPSKTSKKSTFAKHDDKFKAAVYKAVGKKPTRMRSIAEKLDMLTPDSNGRLVVSSNNGNKIRKQLGILTVEEKIITEGDARGRTYRRAA